MTNKTPTDYPHGTTIGGLLDALARYTREAARLSALAHNAADPRNQNLAVGQMLSVGAELEKAQALYRAVLTLHRVQHV